MPLVRHRWIARPSFCRSARRYLLIPTPHRIPPSPIHSLSSTQRMFNLLRTSIRPTAASATRGLRTSAIARSSLGYGDPTTDQGQASAPPADSQAPAQTSSNTPSDSKSSASSSKSSSKSSSSSSSGGAEAKDNASHASSSGAAVSDAPKGDVSTQGTKHGAQGNGPDPQAEAHMGEESGGGKPPSQQETKKVGEKPHKA